MSPDILPASVGFSPWGLAVPFPPSNPISISHLPPPLTLQALRLCDVGLMGPAQHCAKHVVSTALTKWTHSETGQNIWEESQRFLPVQVPFLLLT